jgi:hypothetical protein
MDWIQLVQVRNQMWALLAAVINLLLPQKAGILIRSAIISFSKVSDPWK